MNNYRAKQIAVSVIMFKYDRVPEVEEFLGRPIFDMYTEKSSIDTKVKHYFNLSTLDGKIRVFEGDYIIKYPNGDLKVCDKSTFKYLYEPIT